MNDIKLATSTGHDRTTIRVGEATFGRDFVVIAGPCSVESEEQTLAVAHAVKAAGAQLLRGGCSSPGPRPTASRVSA